MAPIYARDSSRFASRAHWFLLLATLAGMPGCGVGGQHAVDGGRAHNALRTALDGWKRGEAATALADRSPSIVVQDLDWIEGANLVDYQILGGGTPVETNLYVPVSLTLRDRQGKEVKKSVSYVVATSPRLMVFRSLH